MHHVAVEHQHRAGLAGEAGIAGDLHADEALRKIDAWLCDLKDLALKDGLHVYGRADAAVADDALLKFARNYSVAAE